jgi:hypothetical protein
VLRIGWKSALDIDTAQAQGVLACPRPWEVDSPMEHFAHRENIAHYRKLIAASALDPARDESRHEMLLSLLAAELANVLAATPCPSVVLPAMAER